MERMIQDIKTQAAVIAAFQKGIANLISYLASDESADFVAVDMVLHRLHEIKNNAADASLFCNKKED